MKKITTLLIVSIFLITICTLPVSAIDLKTAQKQKTSIDSQIDKLASDKQKVLSEKAKLESTKKDILKTQAAENTQYKQLLGELDELDARLKEISQAVTAAQEDYNRQEAFFKTRLKVMYENSSTSTLDMLLQSKNFMDFFEKIQYVLLISKNDKKIIEELNLAKIDLEYKKQLQEESKQQIQGKANEKKERLTSLNTSRAELEKRLSVSKAELDKLEKREDELLAQSKKLQSTIKNLSRNSKYTGGTMVWPCPSSDSVGPFGMRKHPILRKYKMHTGIDIGASKGASIVAANNGTVILSSYDRNGYGNYLVVDHGGGITTLYGHCSKLLVKVGDKVKAEQVIAKVGMTGLATGNHLHFEVRKDGVPVNPLNGYLSK